MFVIRRIGNDTEADQILNRDFVSEFRTGYVEVGEDNICLPVYYEDYEEAIRTFKVRNDDVFLCGHPKTGTTWAQEMIWLIANNLDYEAAAKEEIYFRSPLVEQFYRYPALFDLSKMYNDRMDMQELQYYRTVDLMKSPRVIKSHLHWSLLPEEIRNGSKQPKIINIMRNPEDTCVSLYYYSQYAEGYKGNFKDFCKLFLAGRVCFGPFWKQVLSYWNERHRPNMLFITYKEMKTDLPKVIRAVANFMEKSITEEQLTRLTEHLSFESMTNNPTINCKHSEQYAKFAGIGTIEFMRSGKIGGYKSEMLPEMIGEFESWTKANIEGTDFVLH